MTTERIDPRFDDLDLWSSIDIATAMFEGQLSAVAAVQAALPAIAWAIDAAAAHLGEHGRLIYVGAGTSGRLACQDGTELPPTFNWPTTRVAVVLAGGQAALMRSAEGAEDDIADARAQMAALKLTKADVVLGVAASGTTPFTVAAITAARKLGALTIAIANNPDVPLLAAAAHPLLIDTGAEVIAGSTRMKAGTAQKVVLNLLSSGIMVRLGRVLGGIMIDMRPTNAKLQRRASVIVAHVAGCSMARAAAALASTDQDIKAAVLVAQGLSRRSALLRLRHARGNLRVAMAFEQIRKPRR